MIPCDTRRKGQVGVSLIELLVAVAIASIMFMAMMQLISNATKALRVLKKRIEMNQIARLALDRMTRELASAFHPYGMYAETGARSPKPWLMVQGTAGAQEISFVANLHQRKEFDEGSPKAPQGDLTEIHYLISPSGSSTCNSHLYRRQEIGKLSVIGANAWTGPAFAGNSGSFQQMLAQNAKKLDIERWDKDGNSTTTDYTGAELGFPSRVRIKLTLCDPQNVVSDQTYAIDVSVMRNTVSYP